MANHGRGLYMHKCVKIIMMMMWYADINFLVHQHLRRVRGGGGGGKKKWIEIENEDVI